MGFKSSGVALVAALLCAVAAPAGAGTDKLTQLKYEKTISAAHKAIAAFRKEDPGMGRYFKAAAGYVVFPRISKGAAGIGGAGGRGAVFMPDGEVIGIARLSQFTVGVQLGGQAFQEVIFFETPEALNNFKYGRFKLAAQLSAVAAADGAAANAAYENGVAVFTLPIGGLMFEASVGGQVLKFKPL